jgi:hypothetical protein
VPVTSPLIPPHHRATSGEGVCGWCHTHTIYLRAVVDKEGHVVDPIYTGELDVFIVMKVKTYIRQKVEIISSPLPNRCHLHHKTSKIHAQTHKSGEVVETSRYFFLLGG